MSLLLTTGFDYYNTSQIPRLWRFSGGTPTITTPGRIGGQALSFINVTSPSYVTNEITNSTTVYVGVAINFSLGDATNPFLILQDDTLSFSSPTTQIDVRITNDAAFQVTRDGSVLGTTGPDLFAFGFWNYLELRATIDNSSGIIQLRLNGETLLNLTSLDTQQTSNNFVNMVRLQSFTTGTASASFDDLYVLNDAGSVNNAFLGECRVAAQYPSANGNENDFAPFGAVANWQCVDELVMDDDTTYVKSGIPGNIDDYAMGTVSFTGNIFAVQINVTHRKDDVGSRTITPLLRTGGTNYVGSMFACQTDYTTAQALFEINPNTSSAWTNTDIDNLNAGLKITA